MKLKLALIVALIANSHQLIAQDYRFGKVSKEELLEKTYNDDISVDAAVLYKEKKIYYNYIQDEGFKKYIDVVERIKIYNEAGYIWGTKNENLYQGTGGKKEILINLKAYTYNLLDNKIDEEKLRNNGIFKREVNKYWESYKFTMPNLKPGCVIEYRYTIESSFVQLDEDVFQYNIPIKQLSYELKVPEYFRINKTLNSRANYIPEISESVKSRKLLVSFHSALANGGANVKAKFSKENLVERTYDIIENIYTADIQDVPAFERESYVSNINNYRAVVNWEIESIKGFDDSVTEFSTNWNQVVKTIYENEDFGGQLQKQNYFESDVDKLLNGIEDPKGKLIILFNYVKSKVKWNNFTGYSSKLGVKDAFKSGAGNIADINLMLVSILRYAGLSANPVLISTRDNGIPLKPTAKGFNYVIVRVDIGGQEFILDATEPFSGVNVLPERAINWQGRVVNEHGNSEWISLKPKKSSKTVVQLNYEIDTKLKIKGKYRNQLKHHSALNYRKEFAENSKESLISKLENDKGEIVIENVTIKNETDTEKPISLAYDFTLDNAVEDINGDLYLSPLLFLRASKSSFKQDLRIYPIDFIYPLYSKYVINIKIPEGYEVKALPENSKVKLNETEGEFTYMISQNGSYIQLIVITELNNTLIMPGGYKLFKSFYNLSFDKEAEAIIFKKKI